MNQTEIWDISPNWTVSSRANVWITKYWLTISKLLDDDVVHTLEMWKNNPDFLAHTFMQQAKCLWFSGEEMNRIFKNISRKDITNIIQFNTHLAWNKPWDSDNLWSLQLEKLPSDSDDYTSLIYQLLHTTWIIEIYPTRTNDLVHLYSVLNHEINHLLMVILYIFRSKNNGASLEGTLKKCASWEFNEVTETLAWLDGGQAPMNLKINDSKKIWEYVWWQNKWQYNTDNPYEMAKLRSYRIHMLQMQIYNLSDTTSKQYQDWCKKVREIIFLWIDQPEYLKLMDDFLTSISSPKQACDQLLSLH